ncbi:hypothetical protein RB653_008911 [Dictyostelium firmibasis]|uniref:Transmembrane protein n=1 Tax=Dictyostelium firmibasis TaxID=79012 RepID=A0AAN7YUE4_9MYCE
MIIINKNSLIISFLILIFGVFNIFGYYNPKVYMIKTYDNPNCAGEVKIHRVLFGSPVKSDFLFIWDDGYRTLNCNSTELDQINFPDYPCAWYPKNCTSSSCKIYFKVNQCINGEKLAYEKLNYLESKYCVVSEGMKLSIDTTPEVLNVYRNEYCYRDFACLKCDLLKFELTLYQTGQTLISNNSLSIGVMYDPEYNYSSHYLFGDPEFYRGNGANNSNFLKHNNLLIFILLILSIILIVSSNF